jgi:hypothetical protein
MTLKTAAFRNDTQFNDTNATHSKMTLSKISLYIAIKHFLFTILNVVMLNVVAPCLIIPFNSYPLTPENQTFSFFENNSSNLNKRWVKPGYLE